MIKVCRDCGTKFNNETIPKCPLCNVPDLSEDKIPKEKNPHFKDIQSFVRQDNFTKKKTASGYRHKQKTKGRA